MKTFDEQLEDLRKKQSELWEQRKPFDEALEKIYKRIKSVENKRAKCVVSNLDNMTFEDKFNYFIQQDSSADSMIRYDAGKKFFKEEFGLEQSGWCPYSGQYAFEILMYKVDNQYASISAQDNFDKIHAGLLKLVTILKPTDEEGNFQFGIFENSLSSNGTYRLLYTPKKEWKLMLTRYSRTEQLKSWKDLKDALLYIQQNLYYGDSSNDEYDDDDGDDF